MNSDTQQRTIVIFTDTFPYCRESERTFMAPELRAAADVYDRVIVVPTAKPVDTPVAFDCPGNVEIDLSWVNSAEGSNRYLRLLRLLDPRTWLRARGDISRSGLTFSMVGAAMTVWLENWVEHRGLDLEHTLFYTFWFDIAALAVALYSQRRSGVHFVSGGHGFDVFTSRGGHLRRIMIEQVDRLVIASNSGRDYILRNYPDHAGKISTRRLGCVKHHPNVMNPGHATSQNAITVLSVANVKPGKRVDLNARLLRDLAIARETTQVKWIHVGDGIEMAHLRSWLHEETMPANFHWELRGALSNEQVHDLYRDETIDWFMMLSEREGGNPISVCEAIAYGVPPIVTDTTGMAEMVDDDCAVILPLDVSRESFIRGMLPYIESDYRREQMRISAAQRWERLYNATTLRAAFFKSLLDE